MSEVTRRNLVANFLGTAWNAIMSVAFVPLYLGYLGSEAYGVISFSAIIASMMTILDLGLVSMLTREMARFRGGLHGAGSIRSLLRAVELGVGGLGLLGLASVWLASDWIASDWLRAESLQPNEIAHALRMLSVVVVLRFIEGLYRGTLNGLQRQVSSNLIGSLSATLRGAGSLGVLAWWSPTLSAFLWWQGAVSGFSLAMFALMAHAAIPRATVSMTLGRRLVHASWPFSRGMLVSSFLVLGLTQVDKLLLSRLLPLAEYGRYNLALQASSCVAMIAAPIGQAFYPRLTETYSRVDGERFLREFHAMAQLISVVAGSIGAVIVVNADKLLLLWTKDAMLSHEISNPVRLLALGGILNSCMLAPYCCQLAVGWTSLSNRANSLAILILIPALIIAVPRAGIVGASAAWAGLNAGYVVFCAPPFFRRQLPSEMARWYLRDLLMPIGSAFAASIAVRSGTSALTFSNTSDLQSILICCVAAAMAALLSASIVRTRLVVVATRHKARHVAGELNPDNSSDREGRNRSQDLPN